MVVTFHFQDQTFIEGMMIILCNYPIRVERYLLYKVGVTHSLYSLLFAKEIHRRSNSSVLYRIT